ncbi:MAG: DUF1577 domain-containing protein [Spirochaetia bacterium]|nr:DUF1577 domain-containing protein [Spirochaetia bacterium]
MGSGEREFLAEMPPANAGAEKQEETMAQAMRRVFGRGAEDYTEVTVIGSEINRIAHLFYLLKADDKSVILNYQAENYKAHVVQVSDYNVVLSVPGFEEGSLRRCRLKFEVANMLYQFEVAMLEVGRERVTIKVPAFIQSAKRRKYTRIHLDDLFMKYALLYRPIFGRRGAGQLIENRYPHLISELRRDIPNMPLINRIITEEISDISPDFEIKYAGQSKQGSLLETLVWEEKKTLFIRDTGKVEHYYEAASPYGLLNYRREFLWLARQSNEQEAIDFLDQVRRDDTKKFLTSYICAPLTIFDTVVGQMYVSGTVLERRFLNPDQAQRVDLLAQLLSYAMSKTVIARAFFMHPVTRVINVSLGGLLFEVTNRAVFDYLTDHDHVKVRVPIRHQELELQGEIARYYPTKDGFNVGIRFYHAAPGDLKVLEQFIYERGRTAFRQTAML